MPPDDKPPGEKGIPGDQASVPVGRTPTSTSETGTVFNLLIADVIVGASIFILAWVRLGPDLTDEFRSTRFPLSSVNTAKVTILGIVIFLVALLNFLLFHLDPLERRLEDRPVGQAFQKQLLGLTLVVLRWVAEQISIPEKVYYASSFIGFISLLTSFALLLGFSNPSAVTEAVTVTVISTPSPTKMPTETHLVAAVQKPTATERLLPTRSRTLAATPTRTSTTTLTATSTSTHTPTVTPTYTSTPMTTPTSTVTVTHTPTAIPTATFTPTPRNVVPTLLAPSYRAEVHDNVILRWVYDRDLRSEMGEMFGIKLSPETGCNSKPVLIEAVGLDRCGDGECSFEIGANRFITERRDQGEYAWSIVVTRGSAKEELPGSESDPGCFVWKGITRRTCVEFSDGRIVCYH